MPAVTIRIPVISVVIIVRAAPDRRPFSFMNIRMSIAILTQDPVESESGGKSSTLDITFSTS